MEKPRPQEDPPPEPKLRGNGTLSPSTSQRRTNNLNSPEFEFWMVRNPSFPQPNLHSADELFVDGIILPLCLLSDHPQPPKLETLISDPDPDPEPEREPDVHEPSLGTGPGPGPEPEPSSSSSSSSVVSTSKRWRDIFKVGDKKNTQKNTAIVQEEKRGEKLEKKKDRKNGTNNTAELNINIWPFSRSRSAGNSGNRPKMAPTRKVSSAPCSRSNSGGESKSKKWPTSPNRGGGGGGIHLGRNSPVWQVRRNGGLRSSEPVARNVDKDVKKDGSDTRGSKSRLGMGSTAGSSGGGGGLNLNVQMCMGYRQNSSCRSDENQRLVGGGGGGGEQRCSGGATVNGGGNGVKMFNLRTLFSKKVY